MDGLKMVCFFLDPDELLPPTLPSIIELVTHRVAADIKSKTDGLRCILHVAAALDDVLWSDIEGSWAILLLEAT